MMKVCWWLQGRLFQLWHCVRDQTEQIEKIAPPPYTFYFYFCIFYFVFFSYFFALFCDDMGHFFCILFFMFTNIEIPDIERRKRKRNLRIGQPQGSLSERIDTVCICWFKNYFFLWLAYLKINSWSVRVVYCGCRYVCARCMCDCQRSPVSRCYVASRACTSD